MSKPLSRIFQGLLRLHGHHFSTTTASLRCPSIPPFLFPPKPSPAGAGLRFFSFKPEAGNAKRIFEKPMSAAASTVHRYQEAAGLQVEAFWKRNNLVLAGAGGVFVCVILWKIMFGVASTFIHFSEGMSKFGFLALSSAIVAFAVRDRNSQC